MGKSRIFVAISLFLFCLMFGQALAQPDFEAIRRDIQRNDWSFEVDESFSRNLTDAQRANLRGYNPPADYQKLLDQKLKIFPLDKDPLPSSIDWRELGGVTPVKNQGECGSCWAFAATAELESYIKIYYGVETDLSEQQVVSCNPYGADCDGGWANAAYFVFSQYGAAQENCMPYVGLDPPEAPCEQNNYKKYGFITGWHSVSNNIDQMKAALQDGPLCTAIDASDEFEAYGGGCYDVPGGWTNHLVLIVGYDDRACGENGAWIIKNSWGPDFGEGGYIYVQYGAGSVGTSLTQLEYTAPPTSLDIHGSVSSEPIYGDEITTLNWNTSGAAAPYVDIWFGADGHCHEYLVAENVPNTGSYDWMVPNMGTSYGSLTIFPSTGTEDGFGLTDNYIELIGHKTRYVSAEGSNTFPFETPGTAAHSINDAVAACTGTDSVLVAGGDYVGTIAVGTTVRLFGGFSEDFSQRDTDIFPTVVQSGTSGMRFLAGSGSYGGVDGFTFRNCTGGNSSDPVSGRHGGGIYVTGASPIISNCIFENNLATPGSSVGYGGAICVVSGQPTVANCTITGNIASKGGAVAAFGESLVSLIDCDIFANSCSDSLGQYTGAGFYAENASLAMTGGRLVNNGGSGGGGGLHLVSASASFDGVELRGNRALANGGGIWAVDSQLTLRNMEVVGNSSQNGSGGGVSGENSSFDLRNVYFTGNHSSIMGGGFYAAGASGTIENCMAVSNASQTAGGMVVIGSGPFTLRNNLVSDNTGGGLMAVGAEMDAGYNNVWQNIGSDYVSMAAPASDISLDPMFVDTAAGDFGLAQFSPCIDGGADDASCLDPDGSRADIGLLGGPGAHFVAPAYVTGAGLTDLGSGQWRLSWDASSEPNISHYVVYRDTVEVFLPTPLKAVATVDHPQTTFEDIPGMDCYYLVAAVDDNGYCGGYSERVATNEDIVAPAGQSELPRTLAIAGVVPNPFNPKTTVSFDVPRSGRINLAIFDIRGRLVKQLVSGNMEAGTHTIDWNGTDRSGRHMAAGVYFARMDDGRTATTAKMVLAK